MTPLKSNGLGQQGMAILMAALQRRQPGGTPGAAAPGAPGLLNAGAPGGIGGLDGMPGAPNGSAIPGMPMNLNPFGRGMGMLGGGAPGPGAGMPNGGMTSLIPW